MAKINENVASQIERMKTMMNYGRKTESKPYSAVEYERTGADGKKYAIIREGAKFHIKYADTKKPSKSDYEYIGGFANHKNYMFESYANALKHFEMKMTSLNEAFGKHESVKSWNVTGRDGILAEASDKMRLEIARQREIMKNAACIVEGKNGVDKTQANKIEKTNIKVTKPKTGDAKGQGGDFFNENPEKEMLDMQKNNIKGKQTPVLENVTDEFMDAPLSNVNANVANGSLGEEEVVDDTEVDVNTETDDFGDETDTEIDVDTETDDFDDELEEFPEEDEEEFEDDSITAENDEDEISSLRAEIESLRSTIDAIAEKLDVNEFDKDEPLYDDSETEDEDSDDEDGFEPDDTDDEVEVDTEFDAEIDDDGDEEEDEETEVFESRNYKQSYVLSEGEKMKTIKNAAKKLGKKVADHMFPKYNEEDDAPNPINPNIDDDDINAYEKRKKKSKDLDETVLHDFGKHPRFKKEPMTYPKPTMPNKDGQYEEGAEEDNTNKPYATEIGNSAPFGDGSKVKVAANSIAENIKARLSSLLKNA